jgi:hypothetical protein
VGARVDGHYLNLPVVESDGKLVGIVDVLKLTYATLEQVSLSYSSSSRSKGSGLIHRRVNLDRGDVR